MRQNSISFVYNESLPAKPKGFKTLIRLRKTVI